MPPRRRKVDPLRVHLITGVVFGVLAAAALALWMFPRFFLALVLLAVSAFVYARLYGFIEQRLEAEEGRLAEELGFDLEDDDASDDDELDLAPKKKRSKKKRAVVENGAPVTAAPADAPAAPPVLPVDPATTG